MSFHSFLKLEQSVLLVELVWHIGVRVMLIEKLNGMESAAVDVEMNIATVEIRGAGFPPRMRHSLIYNYLREPGVSMLQNA